MDGASKKKLCWNCEGRVSLEEENCPYCAVYLGPNPAEQQENNILPPPYRIVEVDNKEEKTFDSPYTLKKGEKQKEEEEAGDLSLTRKELKSVLLPLILLSAGTIFFLFSIVLYLFSSQGILTLRWNGTYWHFYLLFSLPMLLIGWKLVQGVDEEEEQQNNSSS